MSVGLGSPDETIWLDPARSSPGRSVGTNSHTLITVGLEGLCRDHWPRHSSLRCVAVGDVDLRYGGKVEVRSRVFFPGTAEFLPAFRDGYMRSF